MNKFAIFVFLFLIFWGCRVSADDTLPLLVWAERELYHQPAEMIGEESADEAVGLLKQFAKKQGIALLFPMLDLTDLNQVSVNDVVMMTVPTLQKAASRYPNQGMLIVRILPSVNGSTVQAKLVQGGQQTDWNLEAPTLLQNLKKLMGEVSAIERRGDKKMKENAPLQTTMSVTGVMQHKDLRELVRYLKQLSPVSDVMPVAVSGQEVVLSLSLRTNEASLVEAMSAEHKLTALSNSQAEKLTYQWNTQ